MRERLNGDPSSPVGASDTGTAPGPATVNVDRHLDGRWRVVVELSDAGERALPLVALQAANVLDAWVMAQPVDRLAAGPGVPGAAIALAVVLDVDADACSSAPSQTH